MPPKGNPRPRLYTPPLRELTPETSLGFECIEFAHDVVGVTLLPWQQEFLKGALELREDGSYRFRTVLLLVARQAGKSTLAQVLILWKMFVGESKLTLGTAQNLDTAKEVWNGALDMIRGVPDLASQLGAVNNAGGRHEFAITTGERYKIVSPSRGAGRGLSADLVIMDELREQKNWDTWASVSNTTMARPNAQIFAISNAGDASSVVLADWRNRALAELESGQHRDSNLGLFEWSAPDGCAIDDMEALAQANPGLGYTTTLDALEAAMKAEETKFRTENLCQFVTVDAESAFGAGAWGACRDERSQVAPGKPVMLAVDVAADRSRSYLAIAGERSDGLAHLEVIGARAGNEWVVPVVRDKLSQIGADSVWLQGRGAPVSSMAEWLEAEGITVHRIEGTDLGAACGHIYEQVREGKVRHRGQPDLDLAAESASVKALSDQWVWDRNKSPVDASPLVAVTWALWALNGAKEADRVSSYSTMTTNWWEA